MKKALAIVLTLVMVLTLSVTALADVLNYDDSIKTGSIVIENAVKTSTYTAYRLFILDSYSDAGKHAYSVPGSMEAFVESAEGQKYLTYDKNDNWVTWNTDKSAETMQAFANAALDYINANNPAIETATGVFADGKVTFSGLKLGYWLVISSTGNDAVLVLDTTNPEGVMYEKNAQPSLDKVVQEDSTGNWGKTNTADIGDAIDFKVTIGAVGHVEKYVLHDTMSAGLSFEEDSVELTWNGTVVAASKYTVITNTGDGCTFHIDLSDAFEKELNDADTVDTLIFTYTAVLNKNAAINIGDTNTVDLTYTNEYDDEHVPDVPPVTTTTYTFDFIIDKFGTNVETGSAQTKLQGVKFELYTDKNGAKGDVIQFTKDGAAYEFNRDVARDLVDTLVTDANGGIKVQGLDAATYWLVETETNAGYNLLKNAIKIVIGEDGKITYTNVSNAPEEVKVDDVISIENKSGVELPATGGMGTMLFILIGSLLVVATGVVLVTNKRMSKIAD